MKHRRSAPLSALRSRGALAVAMLASTAIAIAIGGCPGPEPRDATGGSGGSGRGTGVGGSVDVSGSGGGIGGEMSTASAADGGGPIGDAGCGDTQSSVDNCGRCGFACSNSHVKHPACIAGRCVPTCDTDWADLLHPLGSNLDDGCETPVRRVFVTHGIVGLPLPQGFMSGDDICKNAAQMLPDVGNHWRAWLSDKAMQQSPIDWQHLWAGAYVLVDGSPVVFKFSDLIAGPATQLLHAINVDETGSPLMGDGQVWTGTDPTGMPTGGDCGGWKLPGNSPTVGDFNAMDVTWTDDAAGSSGCSAQNMHLYCFEQAQ